MPTLLYHTKLTPTSIGVSSAQTGYPGANLDIASIKRPTRSVGAGAHNYLFDLGASVALGGVLMHDVNFASATILTSVDNITITPRGTMTTYANQYGRRRGIFSLTGLTARYVYVALGAGTPLATTEPAVGYWQAGAGYVMQVAETLAIAPSKGYVIDTNFAELHQELANTETAVASQGTPRDTIRWQFLRKYSQSLDVLLTQLRRGVVLIDMGLPQFPDHVWPVKSIDPSRSRMMPKANSEATAVNLTEAV